MDYKKLGLDILEAVGGKENVTVLTHCATRLRFELKDFEKVDTKRIDEMKGVLKSLSSGGQFQVVIGPNVTLAYQAVQEALGNETISEVSPLLRILL